MAKQSKKKVAEEIPTVTETAAPVIETLPTADVTEQTDLSEFDGIGELDVNDRYQGVEVKDGRVLLEQVGTGKEQPPFIIVNALKVKLHADGTATVNGYLTNGKSNVYKVIKKKA
jgi:hypothetical protein